MSDSKLRQSLREVAKSRIRPDLSWSNENCALLGGDPPRVWQTFPFVAIGLEAAGGATGAVVVDLMQESSSIRATGAGPHIRGGPILSGRGTQHAGRTPQASRRCWNWYGWRRCCRARGSGSGRSPESRAALIRTFLGPGCLRRDHEAGAEGPSSGVRLAGRDGDSGARYRLHTSLLVRAELPRQFAGLILTAGSFEALRDRGQPCVGFFPHDFVARGGRALALEV